MDAHVLGRRELVVERMPASAADLRQEDLFLARGALKTALRSRDAARDAHVAAQRVVDEARALAKRPEAAR